MESTRFWLSLDALVATSKIKIDRPKGSRHPKHPSLVYPLDYDFLEETSSGDGRGIDVWIGSLAEREVTGIVCTVDQGKRDAEVKILLGCTREETEQILAVHNRGAHSAILVERPSK
jgi:inorganic pyrophosphatase